MKTNSRQINKERDNAHLPATVLYQKKKIVTKWARHEEQVQLETVTERHDWQCPSSVDVIPLRRESEK